MDTIRVEGLELRCIVGVRPRERLHKQRVLIDLALGVDTTRAARTGRIAHTCDYDLVAEQVCTLLRFREYRLIEAATEELAAMLFSAHAALARVEIRLAKPEALPGRARGASVQIAREREQFPARVERHVFGSVEFLLETAEASIALCHVDPGHRLPATSLPGLRRLDCLLSGELKDGDRSLRVGELRWSEGAPPSYSNPGQHPAQLSFCSLGGVAPATPLA